MLRSDLYGGIQIMNRRGDMAVARNPSAQSLISGPRISSEIVTTTGSDRLLCLVNESSSARVVSRTNVCPRLPQFPPSRLEMIERKQ